MEQQQQQEHTCLGYLKYAQRMLHESETIATNNLEQLAADRERLHNIAKSTERIHGTLDVSENRIAQMEHPWALWTPRAKTPKRNDFLAQSCNNQTVTAQNWGMKGLLHKRTDWTKKWNVRYCIIDGDVLHYYKSTKQVQSKPRGTIILTGATITEHAFSEFGRDKCFSITPSNKRHGILFECTTPSDYTSWITWLRKAACCRETGGSGVLSNSSNALASSLPSNAGMNGASNGSLAVATRVGMGTQEDEALDQIIHNLDDLDRLARITGQEIDNQKLFLEKINNNVAGASRRVMDATRRVKGICV